MNMKKQLLTLALGLLLSAMSYAQTKLVTFQVSNPDSTPVFVFGSWTNFGNFPGTPMTSLGGGVYSATIALPPAATYEYLFVNGATTPTKEILDPAAPCTNGNVQYTNRVLIMGNNDTALCSTWGSCNTCSVVTSSIQVTFQVENPPSTPVYVFGSWTNFGNYPGTVLAPVGNNIYSTTIQLSAATNYEYLYVSGASPAKEILDPAWLCTNGNGQYTNRTLLTGSTNQTVCRKWEMCDSCNSVAINNINVRFEVENPDSTPVYIFGSWTNWSNYPGTPMTLVTGTNTYAATVPMLGSRNIEYLYVNGVGPTKESLDPAGSCTNGNPQYTNRVFLLGSSDITLCGIWNTCTNCVFTGVNELSKDIFQVKLNANGIQFLSNEKNQIDEIEVSDLLGRNIYKSSKRWESNTLIPIQLKSSQLYLVKIKSNNKTSIFKAFAEN